MRVIKPFNFAIGLLGCCPLLLASEPTTRPVSVVTPIVADVAPVSPDPDKTGTPANPTSPDDAKPHRSDGSATPRSRNTQRASTPSQKDLADTMAFMKEHSKNRYDAIQSLPADGEKRTRVVDVAVGNYLNLMKQKPNADLYNVMVQRIEVEDQIFGLVTQSPKDQTPDQAAAAKTALHDQVATLVALGLKERQIRLDVLANTVAQQRQKLQEDTANQAALVDERLKAIQKEESSLLPPANNAGGGSSRGHGSNPRQSAPSDDH